MLGFLRYVPLDSDKLCSFHDFISFFLMMMMMTFQDYVGEQVNVDNFFAVLLGNKTALTGGSGKVVDSGPDDHIFVYYSDHGGPGILGKYLHSFDLELLSAVIILMTGIICTTLTSKAE